MEVTLAATRPDTSAGPQKALEDAVDGFHSILTNEERSKLGQLGAIRDVETVMIFTAQLDRENQLQKGRGVASRLISILQSVHAFSTVVETFVSSNPRIAALVWGSVKFSLLIAVNYTSYFEALSSLFMTFSNHCPRFATYQALYPASTRLQKALCDFHAAIIRCCKHVVETIQRPWQKQLTNAFWQSFDQEFKPYVNEIRYLAKEVTSEIKLARELVHSQEQKLQVMERAAESKQRSTFRKFIPAVEKDLDEIKELQLQQFKRRSREERQRLLEFLSSHDYITPFREACKKRQCNTAEWILTATEFNRWYNGTGSSLLWCSGKIGSGKTILCANVINHILANKDDDVRVAFSFLRYDDSDSLKAETTIRSIIRQIIDTMLLPQDIEHRLKDLSQKLFVGLQDWVDLARQALMCSAKCFIFIDGLDESDAVERRALLEALASLASTVVNLRIFIASRDSVHLDLRGRFSDMDHILMSSKSLALDIRMYIDAVIQERIRNEDLMINDPCLLENVKQTLSEHADGMFLWVEFLINEICTASCDDDVHRLLHTLPKSLEETFSRALLRIITRQRMTDLAQKAFKWVAVAKRPLTLDEIREAVSIEIGQEYSRPDRLVREMSPIVLWSENLLQVTEGALVVQFAHSSIRDFMVSDKLPTQLTSFRIDLENVDHFIGEICVTYLHLNDFKTTIARRAQPFQMPPVTVASVALSQGSGVGLAARLAHQVSKLGKPRTALDMNKSLASYSRSDTDSDAANLLENHPFLKYAAKHWVSHTANFQGGKPITWNLWYEMIMNGHSLAHIPWQNPGSQAIEDAILLWSHPRHHYALLRYAVITQIPLQLTTENLMGLSAYEGDIKAVTIFLEAGRCSMNGLNKSLQAASGGGHLHVMERLRAAGAGINTFGAIINGLTVLQVALRLQHMKRQLAADVTIAGDPDGREWAALEAASEGGHLQAVEWLLKAGASIDASSANAGRTALQAASENGHLQVVERLLAAGADVNAPASSTRWTALQAASKGGHLQVVERLLSVNADIDARSNGWTALQVAAGGGHSQVIERLIAAGADADAAPSSEGLTALQAASKGGHLQAVERLLVAGANVDNISGRWTALQVASENGHVEVVERLLAAKANVNAIGFEGDRPQSALQAASRGGHIQVVERLLAAGADVNGSAGKCTAIELASGGGHLQIVERLLAAKANVNAAFTAKNGRTALQAASEGGYLDVVERLLAAGADVNAPASREGFTALQAASNGGHLQVIERLVAAGAHED